VPAVLIGAGQRGHSVYGQHAVDHPDRWRFVAVVDPDPARRQRFVAAHPEAVAFSDIDRWRHALDGEPDLRARVAVVASPDRAHHAGALAALDAGLDVLVEKPMAVTLAQCEELVAAAERAGRLLVVAHVLRYTPFFATVHRLVTSGRLGDIVAVEHRENVWAFHMAHSFVRGNWARAAESAPMIVAKCCHDLDILAWNLGPVCGPVERLTSIGSLFEFRPERAPEGATDRCVAPCPVTDCPYDARRYLDPAWTRWPVEVLTDDLSPEGRMAALRQGPWGRCVYTAGSDVVDHQVVTMELASGASAVLVMQGHSDVEERTMRYDGTRATLRARFGPRPSIEVADHHTGAVEQVAIGSGLGGGHGGGDRGLIDAFLDAVDQAAHERRSVPERAPGSGPGGAPEASPPPPEGRWEGEGPAGLTSAAASLESHRLAFAAERARVDGVAIDLRRPSPGDGRPPDGT
jgi:predicted dehydrogenase